MEELSMLTLLCLLAIFTFVTAILALMGRCAITVPVLLLSIAELMRCIPLR
jgi:hypothetical protein